ncbi:MAG: alcohol dehydrogenase catalytic domain-containing protein, partial [Rhizorhabdus sp.]
MAITTRAAIAVGKGEPLVVEEVELRDPRPGEVIVESRASGLCHTDLSIVDGVFPVPLPCIAGHEGAGIVRQCGAGVTLVRPGDHVIVNNAYHCGQCPPCRRGKTSFCERAMQADQLPFRWRGEPLRALGGAGSFAAHCVVAEDKLTVIPEDVPFEAAALVPCGVMTGTGAVWNVARVEPGSTVVVFGLGSIGLNVVQAARLSGAARIVAIDTNPAKEAVGRTFGATEFVNPRALSEPVDRHVAALLGGPADYAFECIGNVDLLALAVSMVSPYWGTCLAVGIPPHDAAITLPGSTFYFGRTVRGTFLGDNNPLTDTP